MGLIVNPVYSRFYLSPHQFLAEVLSSQVEEPQQNNGGWCPSIEGTLPLLRQHG